MSEEYLSFLKVLDDGVKALAFNRFDSIFGLTNITKDLVFAPKQVAQRMIAEKRGSDSVEFLSVYRGDFGLDWERQNTPIARRGVYLEYENSDLRTNIVTVKAVPVTIPYDIFVWSRDLDKVAMAVESYTQWLHDSPQLLMNFDGRYPLEMYLKFGTASDETDYNIFEKGLYFVTRLPLTLDGWIFTSFNSKTILTIILDLYTREGTYPNYFDTLINEYIITAES